MDGTAAWTGPDDGDVVPFTHQFIKHCGDATPKGTVEKITDVGTEPPLSFVDPVRIDH